MCFYVYYYDGPDVIVIAKKFNPEENIRNIIVHLIIFIYYIKTVNL